MGARMLNNTSRRTIAFLTNKGRRDLIVALALSCTISVACSDTGSSEDEPDQEVASESKRIQTPARREARTLLANDGSLGSRIPRSNEARPLGSRADSEQSAGPARLFRSDDADAYGPAESGEIGVQPREEFRRERGLLGQQGRGITGNSSTALGGIEELGSCAPCNPLGFSYGCLTLLTWSLQPADLANVPMGDSYNSDYFTVAPFNDPAPTTGTLYTKLGPPNLGGGLESVLRSLDWCCPNSSGVCVSCAACGGKWLSNTNNWPTNGLFTMPSTVPGWRYLFIGTDPGSQTWDSIAVNLTYPNKVDLTPSFFGVGQLYPGSVSTAGYDIVNYGENASSSSATYEIFMSADAAVDESDTLVGAGTMISFPGGWNEYSAGYIFYGSLIPTPNEEGVEYFALKVSHPGGDHDPSNDWSQVSSEEFLPDLGFSGAGLQWLSPLPEVTGEVRVLPNEQVSFSFQYENSGNWSAAATSKAVVYLSTTPTGTGSAIAELQGPFSTLAWSSGVVQSGDHDVTIPSWAQIGSNYWLYVALEDTGNDSNPSNNESARQLILPIAEMDLVLRKPSFWSTGQGDELNDGVVAQTWVNLDNDDNDSIYDYNSDSGVNDDIVTGGDDELVPIEIRLRPNTPESYGSQGHVILSSPVAGDKIVLWKSDDKDDGTHGDSSLGEFMGMGTPLFINPAPMPGGSGGTFEVDGQYLALKLWAEGVGHSTTEYSKLELTYGDSSVIPMTDSEEIYILDIESVQVIGVENGFGAPSHESNTLDPDPGSLNAGVPSVRVFTGGRGGSESTPRNEVQIRVTLTGAPRLQTPVYLKSLDIDDLFTDDTSPGGTDGHVDPNDYLQGQNDYFGTDGELFFTKREDNRNAWVEVTIPPTAPPIPKSGKLWRDPPVALPDGVEDPSTGILTIPVAPQQLVVAAKLEISQMPGDNYAVVVGGDHDFVSDTENVDEWDGQFVVNEGVGEKLPDYDAHVSPVIVVWRLIHIEMDAMMDMAETDNIEYPNATSIVANAPYIYNFGGLTGTLDDGSPNDDDDPPQLGRFEDGYVAVEPSPGASPEYPVLSNGDYHIDMPFFPPTSIEFGAMAARVKVDQPAMQTFLARVLDIQWNSSSMKWDIWLGNLGPGFPSDWSTLTTIAIGVGTPMPIADYTQGSVVSVAAIDIPLVVKDDDERVVYDVPSSQLESEDLLSYMNTIYSQVYMYAELDGCGDTSNNAVSLPFVANGTGLELESQVLGAGRDTTVAQDVASYWAVYVGLAYQHAPETDNDPSVERNTLGQAPGDLYALPDLQLGAGGRSCWIYREAIREATEDEADPVSAFNTQTRVTIAHEIGHQLGVPHTDEYGIDLPPDTSLMAPGGSSQTPPTTIHPLHTHFFRCVVKTPF